MAKPVICPAGQVCDIQGLRYPSALCPPGNYCPNGTKASSLEMFTGDTSGDMHKSAWTTHDPATGVISFIPSSYNSLFTLNTWPAPAWGKSSIQNPPLFQCDGYDCQTGSQNVPAEGPLPCPMGYYCRSGVTSLIPIPKNFSTPQRCYDGFFCPRGSISPEGSGACPNGYFCPTQVDAMPCPEGNYCPGVGNIAPIECYPGTFNPQQGQANCTVCPIGFM